MKYRNVNAAGMTAEGALDKLEHHVMIVAKAKYRPEGGAMVIQIREGHIGTANEPIWIANQTMVGDV